MRRIDGVDLSEKREYVATAKFEVKRASQNAVLLELAKELRRRADEIDHALDRAASVMAP